MKGQGDCDGSCDGGGASIKLVLDKVPPPPSDVVQAGCSSSDPLALVMGDPCAFTQNGLHFLPLFVVVMQRS